MMLETIGRYDWYRQLQLSFNGLFSSLRGPIVSPNERYLDQVDHMEPQLIDFVCRTSCNTLYDKSLLYTEWAEMFKVLEFKVKNHDPVLMFLLAITLAIAIGSVTRLLERNNTETNTEIKGCVEETDSMDTSSSVKVSHLPAEQRALLQFQRNKSEPIVFRYGFELDDSNLCSEMNDQSSVESVRRSLDHNHSPSPIASPSPRPALSNENATDTEQMHNKILQLTEPVTINSRPIHVESPCSQMTKSMAVPSHLSISPSKSSTRTTQISNEQVNAQPFSF